MRISNLAKWWVGGLVGGIGVVATLLPAPARACGGFFCDRNANPNGPPPVAQTAENVLFAMQKDPATGRNHLEAHVQIFYTGPADRFSWVVPVDSMPTLDVGTNRLFEVLDPATRPTFGVVTHEEGSCKVPQQPDYGGTGGAGGSGGGFVQDAGLVPAADAGASVTVSFRGDVGPYDAAVIHSTSTTDSRPLRDWLQQNMYYVSDDAGRLIDDYVKEDKYFVAIRLINGHTVQEIEPLVMRFDGPGPCVPLRLTAIAAIDDLRINLWVLADSRVVPSNYYEIKINPTRINWFNAGSNYDDLVKKAADEAGGNAFVTDYVGPARDLQGRIYSGTYDLNRLRLATDPAMAIQELIAQGFPPDAALLEILRKDLPEPMALKQMGIDEKSFYNQVAYYWQMFREDFAPFDGQTLAADIDARLIQPLVKAQALFDRFNKLSRLSTFISPEEMTVDPLFMTNTGLPEVPVARTSNAYLLCGDQQYSRCEAPIRLELPDGQKLYFKARPSRGYCYGDDLSGADRDQLDTAPALQAAYSRAPIGEGAVRMNRQADIDAVVAAHNLAARAPVTAGGTGGAGGAMTGPMTGGTDVNGSGGYGGAHPGPRRSGCAIGGDAGAPTVLLLLALAVLRRRRR